MSSNKRELYDLLVKIVERETRYLRAYVGKVLSTDDDQQKGRVLAVVAGLGWVGQDKAAWCWPRDKHGISVPAVGEYVEVSFLNGDGNWPFYRGLAGEVAGMVPAAYAGDPALHVLFQDPATGDSIQYDERTGRIAVLGNGDNLVTYSALAAVFSSLATWLNAHVHTGGTISGLTGPVPPTGVITIDPSGAKANHLETNG